MRWQGVLWLLILALASPTARVRAQADNSLELRAPVEEITPKVLELSLPAEVAASSGHDLNIHETKHEMRVELPADILFDFDKDNIRPSAAQALNQAADLIRTSAKGPVRVEGHTDAKGSDTYNQRLSERRANAVRAWLMQKETLKSVTFVTVGFGARRPVAPNTGPGGADNPDGRQRNRRVELVFQKR